MINPLDKAGEPYSFEGMNPNPSASKTKDGPKYRISLEVTEEVFLDVMNSSTDGAIFNVAMVRQDSAVVKDEPAKAKPKHMGSLSNVAAILCQDKDFGVWYKQTYDTTYKSCVTEYGVNNWLELDAHEKCRQLILYACSIDSRAKLDTDDLAANTFREHIAEPFDEFKKR
jgi:hypothetical protein